MNEIVVTAKLRESSCHPRSQPIRRRFSLHRNNISPRTQNIFPFFSLVSLVNGCGRKESFSAGVVVEHFLCSRLKLNEPNSALRIIRTTRNTFYWISLGHTRITRLLDYNQCPPGPQSRVPEVIPRVATKSELPINSTYTFSVILSESEQSSSCKCSSKISFAEAGRKEENFMHIYRVRKKSACKKRRRSEDKFFMCHRKREEKCAIFYDTTVLPGIFKHLSPFMFLNFLLLGHCPRFPLITV